MKPIQSLNKMQKQIADFPNLRAPRLQVADIRRWPVIHRLATVALYLGIALAVPADALANELVGSSESHSIEKFNSSGAWMKTFASTGPWIALGIAASPVTNDVFVATNTGPTTNIILRYHSGGAPLGPSGSYWSTFDLFPYFSQNPVQALLFDNSGNLYVASEYGTSGYQVEILEFTATQLLKKNPVPSGTPIKTTVGRGNQMAFDVFGDICIASFIAPNTVQCYDPNTGVLAFDYASEIQAAGIQPDGLSFDPNNRLTVNSLFTGQVWTEAVERTGPMIELTSGLTHDLGYIAANSGFLYVPSYHNPEGRYEGSNPCTFYACMDYDTSSDVVYKIDPGTGTATNFISNHIWGPYQMIFVSF
jgi:hypothetical protein